jgi:hypothetical protein
MRAREYHHHHIYIPTAPRYPLSEFRENFQKEGTQQTKRIKKAQGVGDEKLPLPGSGLEAPPRVEPGHTSWGFRQKVAIKTNPPAVGSCRQERLMG